jgi:hypothetical protein
MSLRSCIEVDAKSSQTTTINLCRRGRGATPRWRTTKRVLRTRVWASHTTRLNSTRQRIRSPTIQRNQQNHCQESDHRRKSRASQRQRRRRKPLTKEAKEACHTWRPSVAAKIGDSLIHAACGITGTTWLPWASNDDLRFTVLTVGIDCLHFFLPFFVRDTQFRKHLIVPFNHA